MPQLIDVSVPISPELPVWEGDPPLKLERAANMDDGAPLNVTRLECSVHMGTHIDAPLHFIADGKGIDQLDLDRFVGECWVVELEGEGAISADELKAAAVPENCQRLLLKTSNSAFWQITPLKFEKHFRALDASAAKWCVERGLKLIGIDYLSIEPFEAEEGNPTHKTLLSNEIGVIEGLNLTDVAGGQYRLLCLPLKLVNSDGAPARVLLETLD